MSFCRLSTMNNLRMVVQAQQAMSVRGFHMSMDTTRTHHHDGNSEILYDMISSGAHSSTERITKFMNTVYVNKPRSVSLFSFNYRQQTERNTIRGVCIGTNNRRGPAQKNVVIAAGLALQDPSLIGVALYLSAVLSRLSPLLPRDVSVIPLANPREYEKRWKASELSSSIMNFDEDSNSDFSKFSKISRVSRRGSAGELGESEANWFGQENVTLELQDTCKPIETYVTRKNKYFINVEVDLTSQGSTMTYKGNSLSQIANKGKFRDFFINKSSSLSSPSSLSSSPLPSSLFSLSPPLSSSPLIPETSNSLLAPILDAPSIVMELKGNQSLNDEEVVARGEEIISMLRELMTN